MYMCICIQMKMGAVAYALPAIHALNFTNKVSILLETIDIISHSCSLADEYWAWNLEVMG